MSPPRPLWPTKLTDAEFWAQRCRDLRAARISRLELPVACCSLLCVSLMIGRWLVTLLLLCGLSARADEAPTTSMLEPVNALAKCMAQVLPIGCRTPFASRHVVILENFPPISSLGR